MLILALDLGVRGNNGLVWCRLRVRPTALKSADCPIDGSKRFSLHHRPRIWGVMDYLLARVVSFAFGVWLFGGVEVVAWVSRLFFSPLGLIIW